LSVFSANKRDPVGRIAEATLGQSSNDLVVAHLFAVLFSGAPFNSTEIYSNVLSPMFPAMWEKASCQRASSEEKYRQHKIRSIQKKAKELGLAVTLTPAPYKESF
jgi:hypothetical protein